MRTEPELAEIVGAFIGDGFTNVYNKKIFITEFTGHPKNDFKYYHEIIIPLMRYLFPAKPNVAFRSRSLRLRYNSRQIHIFLTKIIGLPAGVKSQTVTIPKIFLKNKTTSKAVLRGIFDTDGCIFWNKRKIYKSYYPRLSITTKSKKLAYQLKQMLTKLGFKPCLLCDKWQNKNAFHIDVYGKKQMNKWVREIGFSNPHHIERLVPQ
jgi:intein/homing endonuclease